MNMKLNKVKLAPSDLKAFEKGLEGERMLSWALQSQPNASFHIRNSRIVRKENVLHAAFNWLPYSLLSENKTLCCSNVTIYPYFVYKRLTFLRDD